MQLSSLVSTTAIVLLTMPSVLMALPTGTRQLEPVAFNPGVPRTEHSLRTETIGTDQATPSTSLGAIRGMRTRSISVRLRGRAPGLRRRHHGGRSRSDVFFRSSDLALTSSTTPDFRGARPRAACVLFCASGSCGSAPLTTTNLTNPTNQSTNPHPTLSSNFELNI